MKVKRPLLLLLVFLFVIPACKPKSEALTWQEQYDIGVRYLSEGNYEEAILAFTAAIEIDPMQEDSYISLADTYIDIGEMDLARQTIANAISLLGDMATTKLIDYFDKLDQAESTTAETLQEAYEATAEALGGTIELDDIRCTYVPDHELVKYSEGALGGLQMEFTVKGPSNVCDVRIAHFGNKTGFSQLDINNSMEVFPGMWKKEYSVQAEELPPFEKMTAHPVHADLLGKTEYILLIGLNENADAVGYAVVSATIPGGEENIS